MTTDEASQLPLDHVIVARAGRTFRLCIEFAAVMRALLWIKLSKDGSLYTAFCQKNSTDPLRLVPAVMQDGSVEFRWDRSESIAHLPPREKMSFHASGVILSRLGRSVSVNLRLLTERTLICTYLPRHPDMWEPVQVPKTRDISVRELIADECPLTIELYYQPAGTLPLIATDLPTGRFVIPIGYSGVDVHERVLLLFVIRRQPDFGEWQPQSFLTWPSVAGRAVPADRDEWVEPS
jgi:hypothetical protein